jgi:hypothetical protein
MNRFCLRHPECTPENEGALSVLLGWLRRRSGRQRRRRGDEVSLTWRTDCQAALAQRHHRGIQIARIQSDRLESKATSNLGTPTRQRVAVTALRRLLPRRVGGRDSPSPLGRWTFPGLGRRDGRVAGPRIALHLPRTRASDSSAAPAIETT